MISPYELKYCYVEQGFFRKFEFDLLEISKMNEHILMNEEIFRILEEDFVDEIDIKLLKWCADEN